MFAQLTRIKIENFKSFKGTTEVILKPFTVVSGGNGSGKSNLLDCVAFALGAESNQLRCNRLPDLVFGCNLGLRLFKSASVTVYFNLEDNREKEFTRVVTWSSSEYLIDAKVTNKDAYLAELKILNFDMSSQNMYILQGTAYSIALRPPKELMSLFERISGSCKYKDRYEKFQKQMKKLTDELHDINKRKTFLQSYQRKLQHNVKEEEKYEQMMKTLNTRQQEAYLIRILIIKKHMDQKKEITKEIQIIKRKKDLCQEEVALLMKNKLLKEQNIENFECGLKEEEIKLEKSHQELNNANAEILEMTSQIDKYTSHIENGLVDINNCALQLSELKHVLLTTNEDIKRLEENILPDYPMLDKNQMHEYCKLEQELEAVTSGLSKELCILRSKQSEKEDKLKWENDSLDTVVKEEKIIMLNLNDLEKKKSDIQRKLSNDHKNKSDVISSLKRSKEIIKKADSAQCLKEARLKEVSELLMNILMNKNSERLQNERMATLEILKTEFSGVIGRVIDICNPISPKYTTCVTKVFGKHMMSIVVTTSSLAIKCIKFLKESKLSRETFLPVDRIHATPFNPKLRYIKEPKGIIPVRDLIKYDLEYERVIDYIVKNTLACETSEDAQYIAYTLKYNAVSLDGCRYWPSGIMSGGELDLENKGGLWDQQFAKLNKEKIYLKGEFEDAIKTRNLELRTKSCLTSKLEALKTKIDCCEEFIKNIESNMLEKRKELNRLQDIKMKIQKNIESINEELKKGNTQIIEMEEKYTKMKTQIFKDFYSKLGLNEFNLEDIRRNYYLQMEKGATLSSSKCALEHQIDYELEQQIKTEEKVIQWKNYIEKRKETLAVLQETKDSINKEISDTQASIHKLKNLLKIYKTELADFDSQIENREVLIKPLFSEELLLKKKDAVIDTEREGMQVELRSILLGCQAIGIRLPIQKGSFKKAVYRAIAGKDINVDFDYSCLPPEIYSLPPEDLIKKHKEIDDNINVLKIETHEKSINHQVISIEKINETTNELRTVNKDRKRIIKLLRDVDKKFNAVKTKRIQRFTGLFNDISENLNKIYQDLNNTKLSCTNLTLENDTDIFQGGIYFCYYAPGKPCTPITSLSSGECTLAGIALLYAIQRYSNCHLLLLDEIDSSLDSIITDKISIYLNKHKQNVNVLAASLKENFCETADQMLLICADKTDESKTASKVISYSFE